MTSPKKFNEVPTPSQLSAIRIARQLHESGPVETAVFRKSQYNSNALQTINRMIECVQIIDSDGMLTLSAAMQTFCADLAQVDAEKAANARPATPAREAQAFRPLSLKYIASARGTRDVEPPRDISFLNGGSTGVSFRMLGL